MEETTMKKAIIATAVLSLLAASSVFALGNKDSNVIHIGATICSEGAYALVGVPYGTFYRAFIDYINQAPEYQTLLNGRTITYTVYDDKGDGAAGKNYIERLIYDDKVDALVGILGTWNVVAAKDILETCGIPSVYFGTGSSAQMFEPASGNQRYMMGVQPLYKTEGRLMYLRAITAFQNVKSIGVVYSTADDGISLRAGVETQAAMDTRAGKPAVVYQSISSSDAAAITTQIAAVQNCDVIIAAGNQAYFKAVYSAAYANSAARPKPVLTSYVNAALTNIPPEAVNPGAAAIYTASWVVLTEANPNSADAQRRAKNLQEYIKVIDWAVSKGKIPAAQKESYYLNSFAQSSYIAIKTFLTGIERLNAAGKPFAAKDYLEAMESARVPVAFSGGVDYSGGQRIGLDSMSFVKYQKAPGSNDPAKGSWVDIDPIASIDELFRKLAR
jgi:ABC-type branched-subunit amino acid transport system substrate-binding protein